MLSYPFKTNLFSSCAFLPSLQSPSRPRFVHFPTVSLAPTLPIPLTLSSLTVCLISLHLPFRFMLNLDQYADHLSRRTPEEVEEVVARDQRVSCGKHGGLRKKGVREVEETWSLARGQGKSRESENWSGNCWEGSHGRLNVHVE